MVGEALAVPASGRLLGAEAEMPPVFATAYLIGFVEWTCVAALTPYLAPHQRTVGTRVEISHLAATPVGMRVTAEVELVEIDGRRLRFKVKVRDEVEPIGDGFHERAVVDYDRFMARLARKKATRDRRLSSSAVYFSGPASHGRCTWRRVMASILRPSTSSSPR